MTRRQWPVADLLPHAGAAVLLDEVIDCTDTGLSACVTISPDAAFYQDGGVPAHVGIEYMAQACGAFSGARALRAGESPRIGFLLGTRRYLATRAWFPDGARLVVTVDLVYRDDEVGVFDCRIGSGGEVLATARLTVAEPKNVTVLPGSQSGEE
ncbi:hotdog family protein [Acidisphaera sp. S103]|uniref:ApeP family dehydratase n=1 Tax=Acidisphaera sp. S103 TaxID=1747223 RepID=UPI00131B315D|nr:hotdog family protein [Acidisphaera sp. S103]